MTDHKNEAHKYHIFNKYWGDGPISPRLDPSYGRDTIADFCGCDLTVGQWWGHFGRHSKSLPLSLYALCKRCYPIPEAGDKIDHVFFCGKRSGYLTSEYYEQEARFEALTQMKDYRGDNLDDYMDHPRVLYNREKGIDLFTVSPYDDVKSVSLEETEDFFRRIIALCSPEYLSMYSVKAIPTECAVYAAGETISVIIGTVHQTDKTLKPFDWDHFPGNDCETVRNIQPVWKERV